MHRVFPDIQGMEMQTEEALWKRGVEQELVLCSILISIFILDITCHFLLFFFLIHYSLNSEDILIFIVFTYCSSMRIPIPVPD